MSRTTKVVLWIVGLVAAAVLLTYVASQTLTNA